MSGEDESGAGRDATQGPTDEAASAEHQTVAAANVGGRSVRELLRQSMAVDVSVDLESAQIDADAPTGSFRVGPNGVIVDEPADDDGATTVAAVAGKRESSLAELTGGGSAARRSEGSRIVFLDQLGQGGMGVVRRARDTDLRRELAVKITREPPSRVSEAQLVRFVEEAQITAQLEHPNIVPIHELGVDAGGRVYFAMKLVRGRSLREILAARADGDPQICRQFGLRRLLDIFAQVTRAVEYAHHRGVVHRDLKPDNIMVGAYGEVLVMDWGLAKVVGRPDPEPAPAPAPAVTSTPAGKEDAFGRRISSVELDPVAVSTVRSESGSGETQAGAVLGTPDYMAPEQASGDVGPISTRADVYSLGVILYELLCGKVPFEADSLFELMMAHVAKEPEPPSERAAGRRVPKSMETLCLAMLEKDPAKRRVSLREVRARIQDFVEGIAGIKPRETIARRILRVVVALFVFGFAAWYLGGVSTAELIDPFAGLHALGWFLLLLHLSTSLRGVRTVIDVGGRKPAPFVPPRSDEVYTSGFLASARWVTAVAPIFQMGFLAHLITWFVAVVFAPEATPAAGVDAAVGTLRAECHQALIVPLYFIAAWFYIQYEETRFARTIERYDHLFRRSAWETIWPVLLIIVLAAVHSAHAFGAWTLDMAIFDPLGYAEEVVFAEPLNVLGVVKTLISEGTFLALVVAGLLLAQFPFGEIASALRLGQHSTDEADVHDRREYFLRSLAIAQVARMSCLYGGAAVSLLTAMNVIGGNLDGTYLELVLLIIGPATIGLLASIGLKAAVAGLLAARPAVAHLVEEAAERGEAALLGARLEVAGDRRMKSRLVTAAVALMPLVLYVLWKAAEQSHDLAAFWEKVPALDWILPVPYLLLVVALFVRDPLYRRLKSTREGSS